MEVTDVRLRRVNTDGRMRAIASITIDHEFVIHDIRVIDGNNGMFVAMPSKRTAMKRQAAGLAMPRQNTKGSLLSRDI